MLKPFDRATAGTAVSEPATQSVPFRIGTMLLWRRIALSGILLVSAVLDFYRLNDEGYGNTYYAAAVKSMLTSWHNFFFLSFDPGGFLAVDKPPLGLWIQAGSARLFGFSGFTMLLPQAVAGVLSVAVLYLLVSRIFGYEAGLLAALILAVTPIAVIDNHNNTPDSLLVLTLLLAALAVTRAAESGKLRWLLLGSMLVGLAFNIKELQAYLVLPALFLAYLVGDRLRWRTRLWHLVTAGAVLLVISLCWIVAVDLTPAGLRPYVSDSGSNSELSLALGYNGLGRLIAGVVSHLPSIPFLHVKIDLSIAPGMSIEIGNPSVFRLLSPAIAEQVSWFLPVALAGCAMAFWRSRRSDQRREVISLTLWGGWLICAAVFFSVARFYHLYYLTMLAPATAALAGIGAIALWNDYRESVTRDVTAWWQGWLLPLTLLTTALLEAHILSSFSSAGSWPVWLGPVVIVALCLVSVALLIIRLRVRFIISPDIVVRPGAGVALIVAAAGALFLLVAPAAWSAVSVANGNGGAWLSQAGPAQGFNGGFGPGRTSFGGGGPGRTFPRNNGNAPAPFPRSGNRGGFPGAFRGRGGFGGAGGALTFAGSQIPTLDPKLLKYLESHRNGARYVVATTTSSYASLFILDTGQLVMTLGGYQGWDKILSRAQLARLVAAGTIRFFLLPSSDNNRAANFPAQLGRSGSGGFAGAGSQLDAVNNDLTTWVRARCTAVPASAYTTTARQSTSSVDQGGPGGGPSQGSGQLYDCSAAARG